MQIKEAILITQIFTAIVFLSSCAGEKEKEKEIWPPPKSNECSYEIISRDTCNRINYGYRQGKWVPNRENKLKDTVFYRNDTIIN